MPLLKMFLIILFISIFSTVSIVTCIDFCRSYSKMGACFRSSVFESKDDYRISSKICMHTRTNPLFSKFRLFFVIINRSGTNPLMAKRSVTLSENLMHIRMEIKRLCVTTFRIVSFPMNFLIS